MKESTIKTIPLFVFYFFVFLVVQSKIIFERCISQDKVRCISEDKVRCISENKAQGLCRHEIYIKLSNDKYHYSPQRHIDKQF